MLVKKLLLTAFLLLTFDLRAEEIISRLEVKAGDNQQAAELIKDANKYESSYEADAEKIISHSAESKEEAKKNYAKDVTEIADSVGKVQNSTTYQASEKWIQKNQNELFAKQSQALPKIDYGITKKEREKDAIAELLHNYRFKPEEVKKNQISHYPLMIFISAAIPKPSIKDLMIQAKQAGGVLVLRGLVGNSLRTTQEFLAKIAKENISVIIDPRLFEIFQVKLVPTFILLSENIQECEADNCQFTPKHDRIAGNITLKYALEQMKDGKGEASEIASSYLKKITGGEL